jgi:hypothetical protein
MATDMFTQATTARRCIVGMLACWYMGTGIPIKAEQWEILVSALRLIIDSNTAFSVINANTNDSHYTQIRDVSKEYR